MKIGYILPSIGELGTAENIVKAARRAEELGYDSLWVTERLLYALQPQTKYGGTPDGSLPAPYRQALDPLETLTFAAAATSRIRLGTSILDIPFYNPVVLARRLTTLDVLSGGRLHVGLGLGWSKDEYDAVGQPMQGRGKRSTEFLRVLKTVWTTDPVEFRGEVFQVPRSVILPKPVQKPHPPLTLAGFAPAALKRAATEADGWHPVAVGASTMKRMIDQLHEFARQAGRDPAGLQVVVRANLAYSEEALGEKRWAFTGNEVELRQDLAAMRELGVQELFYDPTFSPDNASMERYLARMERMRELSG